MLNDFNGSEVEPEVDYIKSLLQVVQFAHKIELLSVSIVVGLSSGCRAISLKKLVLHFYN